MSRPSSISGVPNKYVKHVDKKLLLTQIYVIYI